jgi:MscS family membrane protein
MHNMPEIQMQLLGYFPLAFIITSICFISAYVVRFCCIRYKNTFDIDGRFALHALFKALVNPITMLFISIGIFYGIEAIKSLPPQITQVLSVSKRFSFIICIFWFSISYINLYEKKIYNNKAKAINGLDRRTLYALLKLARALLVIIAVTIVMDLFGVSISGILTVAGIGGAAIGFASKDLLSNFFGAIILFIDKPFAVGDYIKLPNGNKGYVEHIDWRVTKLRTDDTSCIYIANSFFLNMSVENCSMRTHRQINQIMRLEYSELSKLEKVTKEIKEMLSSCSEIDNDKIIDCFIESFDSSYVKYEVTAFTKIINKLEFSNLNQKIMLKIAKIFAKHKLHFRSEP